MKRASQRMGVSSKTKHVLLFCFLLVLPVALILRFGFGPASSTIAVDSCSFPSSVKSFSEGRKFTLLLKVLAYNRLPSLARCLRSLANAQYNHGDVIHLHVYLDHQQADSYTLINQSHHILGYVDAFSWPHGDKIVHYRASNAGLQAQWIEAWWPATDYEFAFVLEDDLEVSPLYYSFVKTAILHFYYNKSNYNPSIYGLTLQRPRFVPGKHGNIINLDRDTHLFLYQLVGTWGQILFPKPWKEFRLWFDEHKAKGLKPLLDGMVTTGWYKKLGDKIWTPWFIKFIHSRNYFNIHTNFYRARALSVSHRDPGVNYGKTAGPDSELITDFPVDFNLLAMQPLSRMKWYDFCFREVLPGRIVRDMDELDSVLLSMEKMQTILLVSISGSSYSITRNFLCHFEKLKYRNFLLVGSESDSLSDLAAKGYNGIDSSMLLQNIRHRFSVRFAESKVELMKDILVKAYVVGKCIENGYHMWVLDTKLLFTSNSIVNILDDALDYNLYVGHKLQILYARGSSANKRGLSEKLLPLIVADADEVASQSGVVSFTEIVPPFLEPDPAGIGTIQDWNRVMIEEVNDSTSLKEMRKILYWPNDWDSSLIQQRLENLSMWAIDADLACKAVVCYQN